LHRGAAILVAFTDEATAGKIVVELKQITHMQSPNAAHSIKHHLLVLMDGSNGVGAKYDRIILLYHRHKATSKIAITSVFSFTT
jgi:hypothetical protein